MSLNHEKIQEILDTHSRENASNAVSQANETERSLLLSYKKLYELLNSQQAPQPSSEFQLKTMQKIHSSVEKNAWWHLFFQYAGIAVFFIIGLIWSAKYIDLNKGFPGLSGEYFSIISKAFSDLPFFEKLHNLSLDQNGFVAAILVTLFLACCDYLLRKMRSHSLHSIF